ncbi:MAG: hypothetical protein HZB16_08210 [Armatimonadetes bacterium]|nr:hypothetical protein [Armatimonadota bacterium]
MKHAWFCLLWAATMACAEPALTPRQSQVLTTAVVEIATGHAQSAVARLRVLQRECAGTLVEVKAQALIGCALERAGDIQGALAAYAACDEMDGCREGQAARWRRWSLERAAEPDQPDGLTHTAWLAATEPRPGLSDAEEIERQNRRARALLAAPRAADTDRRLAAQCPRSDSLPAARLLAAIPKDDWVGCHPEGRTGPSDDLAALRAIAEDYPRSLIGQIAAASVFHQASTEPSVLTGTSRGKWIAPFLAWDPALESHPRAVAWLRQQRSDIGAETAKEAYERAAGEVATELLASGDTAGYLDFCRRYPDAAGEPVHWLAEREPEAARLWLATNGHGEPAQAACEQFVARYGHCEAAPAALDRLAHLSSGQEAEAALRRLAQTYAASGYGLRAAADLADRAGDYDSADRFDIQAATRPAPYDSAESWRARADRQIGNRHARLDVARRCLELLPGWTTHQTVLALRRAEDSHAPADWEPLLSAAGSRAAALLGLMRPLLGPGTPTLLASKPGRPHRLLFGEQSGLCVCQQHTDISNDEACELINEGLPLATWPLWKVMERFTGYVSANARTVAECARLARKYPGTRAANLVCARYGRALFEHEWFGEAESLLAPVAAARGPQQAEARAVLAAARERLEVVRHPRYEQVWRTAPLVKRPAGYGGPHRDVAMDATGLFVLGMAPAGGCALVALARTDGRVRWQVLLPGARDEDAWTMPGQAVAVALAGGSVVVSLPGERLALDRRTGAMLRREPFGGPPVPAPRSPHYSVPVPEGPRLDPVASTDPPGRWYGADRWLLRYESSAGRPVCCQRLPGSFAPLCVDDLGVVGASWLGELLYMRPTAAPPPA